MPDEPRGAELLLRVVAKALDLILIAAVTEVLPAAGFYTGFAYLLIGDGLFNGRSLGKKLIGLRVIKTTTGNPCAIKESILRNSPLALGLLLWKIPLLGWIFTCIIFALEFIMLIGSAEGLRLGDEIARTKVVAAEVGGVSTGA